MLLTHANCLSYSAQASLVAAETLKLQRLLAVSIQAQKLEDDFALVIGFYQLLSKCYIKTCSDKNGHLTMQSVFDVIKRMRTF